MWKFLPSLMLYYFCLYSAWGNNERYPNFDDIREVEKIKSSAVLGEWDEFSNKSLPFDEFRQIHGLQYLRTEQEPFSGCYIQIDSNQKIRNLRYFFNGLLDAFGIDFGTLLGSFWSQNSMFFFPRKWVNFANFCRKMRKRLTKFAKMLRSERCKRM